MASLGDAILFFKADKSDLDQGFKTAEKDAGGFVSRVGGMLGTGLKAAFAAGAVGIVGAMGGIFKGIASNADFEAFEAQFASLYGTIDGIADPVQAAKDHIADLSTFAASTPFDLPGVIKASKNLLTFGGAALDTQENLNLVGNAAAASGQNVDQVAFWYGRAYNAIKNGQPFGEAASELQNMGIMGGDARLMLEQLQKEGASGEEVWKAFQENINSPTDAMEKLGKTWNGLMSTLGDTVDASLRSATAPLFKILKPALESTLGWLGSPKIQGAITQFGEKLGAGILEAADFIADAIGNISDFVTSIKILWEDAWEFTSGTWERIGVVIDTAILGITDRIGPFQRVGIAIQEAFSAISGIVTPIINNLIAAFSGQGLQGGISSFLGTLGQISPTFQIIRAVFDSAFAPIQSIITTMFTVVSGFIATNGADIMATVQNVWGQVQTIINTVIPPIQQVVTTIFGAIATFLAEHGTEIQTLLTTVWQTISMAVQTALTFIQEYIVPILAAIAQFIADHGAQIQTILTGAWEIIKGIITGAMEIIQGIINTVMALINGDWSAAWEGIKQILSGVWTAIEGIVTGALKVIGGAIQIAWDAVKVAFDVVWSGIKTTFEAVWSALSTAVSTTLDTIGKAIDAAWLAVSTVFTTTWDAIEKAFSGTWTALKKAVDDVLGPIQLAIETAWAAVAKTTEDVFNGLKTTVSTVWNGILTGLKAPINTVIGVVNALIEGASAVGEAIGFDPIPTIPYLAKGTNWLNFDSPFVAGEKGPEPFRTPGGQVGVFTGGMYTAPRGTQVIPFDKAFGSGSRGGFSGAEQGNGIASEIGGALRGLAGEIRAERANGIVGVIGAAMGEMMSRVAQSAAFAGAARGGQVVQNLYVNGNPDQAAMAQLKTMMKEEGQKIIDDVVSKAEMQIMATGGFSGSFST